MFTAENFRRIFDAENRKGLDVAGLYFPHLDPMTDAVRDKVAEIRTWRKDKAALSTTEFKAGEVLYPQGSSCRQGEHDGVVGAQRLFDPCNEAVKAIKRTDEF